MPRKISDKLIESMMYGKYKPMLDYVRSDASLRLEVRRKGNAYIYYRKGKVLEMKEMKVDPKFGKTPSCKLAVSAPEEFFTGIKQNIDTWIAKKKKVNYDIEQKIATQNQDINDKYIILDMEYAFNRKESDSSSRIQKGAFDLLGIERKTGRTFLFNVKTGIGSSSAIDEQIKDFDEHFRGNNRNIFTSMLQRDVRNIVKNKQDLGLLHDFELNPESMNTPPELAFIFQPTSEMEAKSFGKMLKGKYPYHIVSSENYKLT